MVHFGMCLDRSSWQLFSALAVSQSSEDFLKKIGMWGLFPSNSFCFLGLSWTLASVVLKVSANDSLVQPGLRTTTWKFKTFNREYVSPRKFVWLFFVCFPKSKADHLILCPIREKRTNSTPSYSHIYPGKLPIRHLKNSTLSFISGSQTWLYLQSSAACCLSLEIRASLSL